jgi:AraC-like DNA-binding protein
MNYQTFKPQSDFESFIKCYWTLNVPKEPVSEKQRILPDGCIEMIFTLGDDIKRYTTKDHFIIQPRAMILGQISKPFFIEPTGVVDTFAVRFYPSGFAPFTKTSIKDFADKETAIELIFGKAIADELEYGIANAPGSINRIQIIEKFLSTQMRDTAVVDSIVKSTIDTIFLAKGRIFISEILKDESFKRRQLERKFSRLVGISPKQLGKIVRLQETLKMVLHQHSGSLTDIGYENEYFDQSHFIKDFKGFTGVSPKEFYKDISLSLSSLIYSKD